MAEPLTTDARLIRVSVVVFALAATLFGGCGGPPPAPPVTLRIGLFQTQDLLPYFVMREQGLDRRNGLSFVEASFAGGAGAIDAIVAGSLDMCPAAGTVPILVAAERGLIPEKIMPVAANNFSDREHRGIAVLVAPSIRSWKDLEGKRIATNTRNSITTAAVVGRLKLEGVRDYSLIEIPFSNMGLAVAGGNVAAAGMNEPFMTQSLLRGDGKLLDWVSGGPPFERAPFTAVVFSAEFHRRNPEGVKAYLRAHLAAVTWINANVEKARAVLARRLELTKDVGEKMNLLRWPADARNDPALLEGMQPMLIEIGVLKGPIPATRLYDETLLEQVLAEKGSVRR